MFAYCNNNPIMLSDPFGNCPPGFAGPCPGPLKCKYFRSMALNPPITYPVNIQRSPSNVIGDVTGGSRLCAKNIRRSHIPLVLCRSDRRDGLPRPQGEARESRKIPLIPLFHLSREMRGPCRAYGRRGGRGEGIIENAAVRRKPASDCGRYAGLSGWQKLPHGRV